MALIGGFGEGLLGLLVLLSEVSYGSLNPPYEFVYWMKINVSLEVSSTGHWSGRPERKIRPQ